MKKLLLLALLGVGLMAKAQDLEQLDLKPPRVELSGSLTGGLRLFNSNRPNLYNNSDFGYIGIARINLKVGNFLLPFSYRLGDQLNLPNIPAFRYWGLSPRYKGLTLHLGYRSNRFSRNTLENIQQYGLGLEWQVKDFNFKVSKGILNRDRIGRVIFNTTITPLRERPYIAAAAAYKKGYNELTVAVLSAKEAANSTDTIAVKNRVVEIVAGKSLGKKIRTKISVAGSYTERDRAPLFSFFEDKDWLVQTGNFLGGQPNLTTKTGLLLDASAGYHAKRFSLAASIRQVDAGFETFGRNFQLNDLRAYTLKTGIHLLKHKLIFNASVGIEENNIRELRANQSERFITNANLSYRASSGASLQLNLSNFNLEKANEFVVGRDSFNFSYQSLNIALTSFIPAGQSQISTSINYVRNSNDQPGNTFVSTGFYYGQINFNHANHERTWQWQIGLHSYYTSTGEIDITSVGGNIGCSGKVWQEKLQLDIRYVPNRRLSDTELEWTHLLHGDISYQTSPKSKIFLQHYTQIIQQPDTIHENQTRLGFQFNF